MAHELATRSHGEKLLKTGGYGAGALLGASSSSTPMTPHPLPGPQCVRLAFGAHLGCLRIRLFVIRAFAS